MNTIKFKTNINCGACVNKVTPVLNSDTNISQWNVDTQHPDKILTVEGNITADKVVESLKNIGYKAEEI